MAIVLTSSGWVFVMLFQTGGGKRRGVGVYPLLSYSSLSREKRRPCENAARLPLYVPTSFKLPRPSIDGEPNSVEVG